MNGLPVPGGKNVSAGAEFLEAVWETAPVAFCLTDARGRCSRTNAEWQRLSGLTNAESLGDGWIGLTWPDHESEGKRWLAAPGRRLKDWASMLGRKPAISRTARVASAAGSPA